MSGQAHRKHEVLATDAAVIYFKPKAANTILTVRNFPGDNQNSASSQNRIKGPDLLSHMKTAKTDKIRKTIYGFQTLGIRHGDRRGARDSVSLTVALGVCSTLHKGPDCGARRIENTGKVTP